MRLKQGEAYFNNNSSLNMNIFLENYPEIPIATEEYEEVKVEGRNGSLYINKKTYIDKPITFTFTLVSSAFEIDFEEVYKWLTDIQDNRLVWGREDRCYLVKKVTFGNLKKEFRSFGEFDVTFICEPFGCDLEETDIDITSNNFKLLYQGTQEATPILRVYGTGDITLTINKEAFEVKNISNYVDIDSKLLEVRDNSGGSKDNDTLGNFPILANGLNTISYSGTVTKINIKFRTVHKGA